MTRLLSLFGLMRVSEHERRIEGEARACRILETTTLDHIAKFKKAVTDLEKQAGEIARLKTTVSEHRESFAELTSEIAELLPDALAMRKKRAADRKRMAGKRGKA